tara:strand:- start:4371 stop:5357 length:987 start_codon:yes stop_codon:yes gene_type:complete
MLGSNSSKWENNVEIFDYEEASNPIIKPMPIFTHPPELHRNGTTRVIPFKINEELDIDEKCTSPNLMASFIRICVGENIDTEATATSQVFYVIRGKGKSISEYGEIEWNTGDLFVLPFTRGIIKHLCLQAEEYGGAALYWVNDEPLMNYLGVSPRVAKFDPTLYTRERMLAAVEEITQTNNKEDCNRLGILLGNKACQQTKTLTHVMWGLLNSLPPNSIQKPHRHNSVALDLAVSADSNVYTLMGRDIDSEGNIIEPIRCDWVSEGVFTTPPGWWHSHHNESDKIAWVLPIQDAGLFTHQRTLDIRFADDEIILHHNKRIRGATLNEE